MKPKNSLFRPIAAAVLAALLAFTLFPGTFSVNADSLNPQTSWQYSKSKTATNLDDAYQSEVTLSLPSSEEQLTTEICFVLDKSSFSDTKDTALSLLSDLKSAISVSSAKVQVDIVEFNRTAHDRGSYDLMSQYDEIVEAFTETSTGGTNMHAGLLLAQEILARNTSIPDSRKYMILISDGDTYLYCKNGDYNTPYSRAYAYVESAGSTAYGGYYDESVYYPSRPLGSNTGRPSNTDSSAASWDAYLQDVAVRNNESNGDSCDFVWKYYDGWQSMTADEIEADGYISQPRVERSASNIDMAFLYASETYHELAEKYNTYSVAVQSLNQSDGGHRAFMDYLNDGASVDFEQIENEILYFLGAGSYVEDYMGYEEGNYNFDLTDPASITVTLDQTEDGTMQTYSAVEIGENHYGFGPQNEDGTYSYEVTYVPGTKAADEHIIWSINVPVTNFVHVSLTYTVTLKSPKTESGTYGTYDADGSAGASGLYTNSSAVLYPVTSDGTDGTPETFAMPSVSYTLFSVTYTDGVDGEEIFADQNTVVRSGSETPGFDGTPARGGYTFKGWTPSVADTVTEDVIYTAVWEKLPEETTDEQTTTTTTTASTTNETANTTSAAQATQTQTSEYTTVSAGTEADTVTTPQTGDTSEASAWAVLLTVSAACLAAAAIYRIKERKAR